MLGMYHGSRPRLYVRRATVCGTAAKTLRAGVLSCVLRMGMWNVANGVAAVCPWRTSTCDEFQSVYSSPSTKVLFSRDVSS